MIKFIKYYLFNCRWNFVWNLIKYFGSLIILFFFLDISDIINIAEAQSKIEDVNDSSLDTNEEVLNKKDEDIALKNKEADDWVRKNSALIIIIFFFLRVLTGIYIADWPKK